VHDVRREVAEAALAHLVGDQTELAYRRGDALEKRRKLMDAWAAYCGSGRKIIPVRPVARKPRQGAEEAQGRRSLDPEETSRRSKEHDIPILLNVIHLTHGNDTR
jgi:hypothetical protein